VELAIASLAAATRPSRSSTSGHQADPRPHKQWLPAAGGNGRAGSMGVRQHKPHDRLSCRHRGETVAAAPQIAVACCSAARAWGYDGAAQLGVPVGWLPQGGCSLVLYHPPQSIPRRRWTTVPALVARHRAWICFRPAGGPSVAWPAEWPWPCSGSCPREELGSAIVLRPDLRLLSTAPAWANATC